MHLVTQMLMLMHPLQQQKHGTGQARTKEWGGGGRTTPPQILFECVFWREPLPSFFFNNTKHICYLKKLVLNG